MAGVKSATADWDFDAVTIGFPGSSRTGSVVREPLNLGGGWLDANLERAFDRPVRIINDAALQALASYEGGRMLFVGFGTSIGSALVADDTIVPVELGLTPVHQARDVQDAPHQGSAEEAGPQALAEVRARVGRAPFKIFSGRATR